MTDSAEEQTARLPLVEAAVASLESSLGSGDHAAGVAAADELVALTSGLIERLRDHPGPQAEAHAELVAAVHVYRNAAFAFRRLAGTNGEPDEGLASVCAAMIEQGRDHLRRFYLLRAPSPGPAS